MHFLIVPINRTSDMGFWVQADSEEQARRFVSLNVPGMEQATNGNFATCQEDQTRSPGYGVIVDGSGHTYTVEKRY